MTTPIFSKWENSKKWNTPMPVPLIDLDCLVYSEEYALANIKMVKDIVFPFTIYNLHKALWELFVSCKLSFDAIQELIEVLAIKGIKIMLPKDAEPSVDYLPCVFSKESIGAMEEDLEHKQIRTFLDWQVSRLDLANISEDKYKKYKSSKLIFGERGHNCGYEEKWEFISSGDITLSIDEAYPYNLISTIFGEVGSVFVYPYLHKQVEDAVERQLETLTQCERNWIELFYKYGVQEDNLLEFLGLSETQTLIWGVSNSKTMQKGYRKLRHPSRSRYIRRTMESQPYKKPSVLLQNHYTSFRDSIIEDVKRKSSCGASSRECLEPYYRENVVSAIEMDIVEWIMVPSVSIDALNLSWKTYTALKQADISNLEEIWNVHGRKVAIGAYNTGLKKIYGLGENEINELFSVMERNIQSRNYKLDPDKIPYLIAYAENLSINACNETESALVYPNLLLNYFPITMVDALLRMKYRCTSDVFSDYCSGKLMLSYADLEDPKISWEDIYQILGEYEVNRYGVMVLYFSEYWYGVKKNKPQCSFRHIRDSYLNNVPLEVNPMELEKNIETIFPDCPFEFQLMHDTKNRIMHWIPWPVELIDSNYRIKDALFGGNPNEMEMYVLVQAYVEEQEQYLLYTYEKGQLIYHSSTELYSALFECALFNAELFSSPQFGNDVAFVGEDNTTVKGEMINQFLKAQYDVSKYNLSKSGGIKQKVKIKTFEEMTARWRKLDLAVCKSKYISMPIESLELTARTYKILKEANVSTVGDIAEMYFDELIKVKNLGKKSFEEIECKLHQLGILSGELN